MAASTPAMLPAMASLNASGTSILEDQGEWRQRAGGAGAIIDRFRVPPPSGSANAASSLRRQLTLLCELPSSPPRQWLHASLSGLHWCDTQSSAQKNPCGAHAGRLRHGIWRHHGEAHGCRHATKRRPAGSLRMASHCPPQAGPITAGGQWQVTARPWRLWRPGKDSGAIGWCGVTAAGLHGSGLIRSGVCGGPTHSRRSQRALRPGPVYAGHHTPRLVPLVVNHAHACP